MALSRALGRLTCAVVTVFGLVTLSELPAPAVVTGPPNPQTAPPGHYMLFVLDQARTPSIARVVHLQ